MIFAKSLPGFKAFFGQEAECRIISIEHLIGVQSPYLRFGLPKQKQTTGAAPEGDSRRLFAWEMETQNVKPMPAFQPSMVRFTWVQRGLMLL